MIIFGDAIDLREQSSDSLHNTMKAKTARLGGHRGGIGGLRGAGEVVAHVAEELRAAVRAVAGVHRVDPHGRRGNAEGYQLRRPYQGGHPRNQLRIRREDRVGQGDWVDIWFGDGGHIDGLKMHCRGWKSVYCIPERAAFKGSAPINLSDRLHQVLRWALGSVEIFLSRHCPLWYGYGGNLKWLERFAYTNTIVYPFTSIPFLAYCTIPAICLLTVKFIIPTLDNIASVWFLALFLSIIATGILELRWSGVTIQDWWRNEQFWVIGGVSAHLFAVFQGLLKVLGSVDTNFTVTAKAGEDSEFGKLYLFKWTTLLIPPTTLIILNMVGVVAGVSDANNNGYGSWGPLFGKLFFSFGVIVHLYPFLKGLMGRQNRTPTIVVLWSILLASIFSLVWVRIDPFLPRQQGPVLKQCGVEC
ncbi:unnamed protein product [Musa acuminata subsp. malaccensis]|uniref:(wild Malaysian banana) hypothetical protein n=1 Tax=Musa acuminata subsp. malaccensis TaxID=214687 RepID=A0A8D7A8I5_MUSAM|nr:unnamed protein product [Musa acuminata subsp. malaccensis]